MITVIGLGFVGLTTAVGLAYKGFTVYGYENDEEKLDKIKNGNLPFYEPHIDKALISALENKNFVLGNDLQEYIKNSELIIFCVGTPSGKDGAELSFLKIAIKSALKYVNGYKTLVIKSTVPPGTTAGNIKKWIEEEGFKVGESIGLANNPEFLREGKAWEDFMQPDRIVIGEYDKKSGDAVQKIYEPFNVEIFRVSLTTAEFIKYLSNTFLATLISFSNEMATFAEIGGDIDISCAFKILHRDKRWFGNPAPMTSYVYPGCGFGGYCLPKDTLAIIKKAEEFGLEMKILKCVTDINEDRKRRLVEKLKAVLGGNLKGKKISVLGLSFKPGTTDVREAPAKDIIEQFLREGVKLKAYDPMAMEDFKKFNLDIEYANCLEDAVRDVDAVVIITGWEEFKKLKEMRLTTNVIDGRFILEEDIFKHRPY